MSLEQNAEKLSESVDITESRYGIGNGVQERANLSNPSKYVLKGKRKINEFKYCLAFDLAHRLSGYALVDVKNREVLEAGTYTIDCKEDSCYELELKHMLQKTIDMIVSKYGKENFFVAKEREPLQKGPITTIFTLIALARVHGVFNLIMQENELYVYDFVGVHPLSVKAYMRKQLGLLQSPSKTQIKNWIEDNYDGVDVHFLTEDVTDAVAVAETLFAVKYNLDIKEMQKVLRAEMKSKVQTAAAEKYKEKIADLQALLLTADDLDLNLPPAKLYATTRENTTIDLLGADLLTYEEYELNRDHIINLNTEWWLKTKGTDEGIPAKVMSVLPDGNVNTAGRPVNKIITSIRPVLRVDVPENRRSPYKTGEKQQIGDYIFTFITPEIMLCDKAIFCGQFGERGNNYERSDVRFALRDWFNDKIRGETKKKIKEVVADDKK